VHIVETEPFGNTFGPKAQRKRPRLDIGSIEELGETTATAEQPTEGEMAGDDGEAYHPTTSLMREPVYAKGTSRRIWGELYKVLDSSDVVIHVLDARDPMGTRCKPVVEYIRKEKAHKHLVYVLNKVDLVPTWVTVSPALLAALNQSLAHPSLGCIPHSTFSLFRCRVSSFTAPFTPLPPHPHSSQVHPQPPGSPTRLNCYESGRASVTSRLVPHLDTASCSLSRPQSFLSVLEDCEGPGRYGSRPN